MIPKNANIWWGPPRKFTAQFEDRRISWLELFYDLVYVIVISAATHRLAEHPGWAGLGNYLYLFIMIFWGWVNGSLYHDLHGSPGIRTRFMTLWQMMAVAAMAVALNGPADKLLFRGTITLAVLQGFITYLWWSVGIYDKHHRKLNVPYTVCYIGALISILATLFIPLPYVRILFGIILVLNFLPPFWVIYRLKRSNEEFSLSTSMMERLGLLTIIVFGEAILGVIGGTSRLVVDYSMIWINFGLGILIVFSLWWIYFALVADRENKKGFLRGQVLLMVFIPTLASLGMTGASFPGVMAGMNGEAGHDLIYRFLFGSGVAVFLWSITVISLFLEYPKEYNDGKVILQRVLVIAGIVVLAFSWIFNEVSVFWFLMSVFVILFILIFVSTRMWFRIQIKQLEVIG